MYHGNKTRGKRSLGVVLVSQVQLLYLTDHRYHHHHDHPQMALSFEKEAQRKP
jgi:hypothetical protein